MLNNRLKKLSIFLWISIGVVTGCSKLDKSISSASVGNDSYTLSTAYAYLLTAPSSSWTNVELCLLTSDCYYDDGDLIGKHFYIDLYWDGEFRNHLIEGTFTLGDDVLDEVTFSMASNDDVVDILTATEGTLTISNQDDEYKIIFSGTAADGTPIAFDYSGPVKFIIDYL